MSRLLLVRHGQTEFNAMKKFAGFLDVPLSQVGRWQMEKLRDRLASVPIDVICSSDLKRSRESAEIIVDDRKIDVVLHSELREINYGKLEGMSFDEISQLFPSVAKSLIKRDSDISFPDGECFRDLEMRVRLFLEKLPLYGENANILIVSHSGPLLALVCFLMKAGMDSWWRLRMDNASLSIIETYPEINILTLFNDTSHLKK